MGAVRISDVAHAKALEYVDYLHSQADLTVAKANATSSASDRAKLIQEALDFNFKALVALRDLREGKLPKVVTPGMVLAETILEQVRPKAELRAAHAGNWPADAVAAIEYESFHRDFGNRSGGISVRYFTSEADVDTWLSEEQSHIRNIDYAYSVRGTRYAWDLGPEVKGGFDLG